ncbi:UvrD-helicase domain-containing protein [Methylophilaceae bacterium]|jgi:DNA helicase-2/ATP-dependent DNA helicase PcrA|nr:UvrD-helicase domain-containing protein [Methylophilaceae bacterium]MDB4138747.1 UvrD-helicase domain-containing protein [Methylophilaceae bacterium]
MNQSINQNSNLADLNEKQIEAVTTSDESALILAGAGSGKTKVLTSRVAWLIHNQTTSPGGILAVTFTNKAAKEMLVRISSQLPINTRGMWVGTFHGLCNRFLKKHHKDAGLPEIFQILDSADQKSAIKRVMKSMNIDEELFTSKDLQYFINANKEEGVRSNDYQAFDDISKKKNEVYSAYEKKCQKEGVVDFAELLLRCLELLQKNVSIREHYQSIFKHILVDEFQDTSKLQYQWLKLLTSNQSFIFAVGDDDQSIYGFRGASPGNMKDLQNDFKIKNVIKLEQNYRSTNNILNAANAIIDNNKDRLGKNLWASLGDGDLIRQYTALDDRLEAAYLVDEIKMMHRAGSRYDQIAILYRNNAQSRVIEMAMVTNQIPYRVFGGLRFFDRAEVKHTLAYLRLISNKNDDNAFIRIVNFPPRGIGARSIEQLDDYTKKNDCSMWEAAKAFLSENKSPKISIFVNLIQNIEDQIHGTGIDESIDYINTYSGLKEHYAKDKDGGSRIENLDELVSAAKSYMIDTREENSEDKLTGNQSLLLAEFLDYTSLESGELQASAGDDALQLMTIHSSKGLEFDVVFITGLEDGLCPHERSLLEQKGIEEERRLMYVAVTRARNKLYLSLAQSRMTYGQPRYNLPSRFLDEIPEELIKRLNSSKDKDLLYSAPTIAAYSESKHIWKVGTMVSHQKFGQGMVTGYEGNENDLRIQIKFSNHGIKWLAMEYAKLSEA